MWRSWRPHALLVEICNGAATLENSWAVPPKVKRELPCDPATPLLDVNPGEVKTYVLTKTFTWIFIALFIMAKRWNHPKRPSTDKWANKMQHIRKIEYNLTVLKVSINTCYNMNEMSKHRAKRKKEGGVGNGCRCVQRFFQGW